MSDQHATTPSTPPWVVGLGASAGGLRALEAFFDACPDKSGGVFVVVQHLSPDFKSLMTELLSRHTGMPIHRVEDGMALEPNTVYLMPPKVLLSIEGSRLRLMAQDGKQRPELPIDAFFTSMAENFGDRAIGIVLSGTGSDGSKGVQAIHRAGGVVLVQSEETAEFDGMPHNAIATQTADRVLPPGNMPAVILEAMKGSPVQREIEHTEISPLSPVLDILVREAGIDFHAYKPATVQRRIERRMGMRYVDSLDDYRTLLEADPNEVRDLLNDLLIGVTGFLRDRQAFDRLGNHLLPDLFERCMTQEEVRVWVAGCATGEEAYSMAYHLRRQAAAHGYRGRLRIFATDAHRPALAIASAGVYSLESAATLSDTEREELFEPESDGRLIVRRALRDLIVFAPHNLLTDPPFTAIDLISCRNLLIYLEPRFQDYVLSVFHYALNLNGILFLGASEGLGRLEEDYAVLDNKWKLFQKERHRALALDLQRRSAPARGTLRASPVLPAPPPNKEDRRLLRDYDAVLAFCQINAFLVDNRFKPLHVFGEAGSFLSLGSGRVDDDLLSLTSGDLRIALGTALNRCIKTRSPTMSRGIRLDATGFDGDDRMIDLVVQPLGQDQYGGERLLVVLQGERSVPRLADAQPLSDAAEQMRQRINDLEQELMTTKESLQATIEELQTTNEELQSTNEELQAANEELQSANEELHSVNEELYTVNAEYETKNSALQDLNRDHENLLAASDVGTVFLDQDLCIRKYNQAVDRFLPLMPQDLGRPIHHIAYNLPDHEAFIDDLRSVLVGGPTQAREIQARDGSWLWRRVVPFKDEDGVYRGVVLTITDIDPLKQAESMALRNERRFRSAMEGGLDAFALCEASLGQDGTPIGLTLTELNTPLERLIGRPRSDVVGQQIQTVLPLPDDSATATLLELIRDGGSVVQDVSYHSPTMGERWLSLRAVSTGDAVACTWIDLSDQRRNQQALATAKEEAEEANQAKSRFLATLSHELRTPLNGAIGMTELLLDSGLGQDQTDWANTALACSQQLAVVIHDLLDYGAIGSGQMRLNQASTNLIDLIEHVASLGADLAHKKGLEFNVHWHRDLPEELELDGGRLTQALLNLVGNGVKYTPSGSVELSASCDNEGHLLLSVDDSGPGVPESDRELVFKPFTQREMGTDRSFDGVGIGLAVVNEVVALMGGQVSVGQSPLGGARFTISIPATPLEEQPRPILNALKLILVSTEHRACHGVAAALERLGATITMICDGGDGPLSWSSGHDAVLIHSSLGGANDLDWQRLEELRKGCSVPAFVLVAKENLQEAQAQGANGLIPLPLKRRFLCARLRQAGLSIGSDSKPRRKAGQPKRILVVDDNDGGREVLGLLLRGLGYETTEVEGAEPALEIAQDQEVDLVLMDLHMPGIDGWGATKRLRALGGNWREIPIIACAANANPSDHRRCLREGMDGILVKPIRKTRLQDILETWLSEGKADE